MYNYYRQQWLVDRLGNTLAGTFGHSPCLLSNPQAISLAVVVVGATPADQRCEKTWAPTGTPPEPSTDDRPFLYVAEDTGFLGIPTIYFRHQPAGAMIGGCLEYAALPPDTAGYWSSARASIWPPT